MGKFLRIALLFSFVLMCLRGMAQNQETVVQGTVADEKGVTLPGVTVAVKDSKTAVVTDISGKFRLTLPANAKILVFTFIGAEKQEVVIGNKTTFTITLKSSTTALSDINVVAIGYGSQRRQDVNGAISSVKAADIANVPQASIDQMLQGRVSGVTITQNSGAPGSQTSVHIRGITSLSGSNEPLYVIDGVAISGDALNRSTSGRSVALGSNDEVGVSPLSLINPSDIESIDVLKDASATAIYGSRASNGVIIITTKRGKNGSARIGYDGYYGIQTQGKFLKMMNLPQYAKLQNELADNVQVTRRPDFANPDLLGNGTNWQDEVFRTAPMQSHQVSISGGKEGTDYYISNGYYKQDGTIIGSRFKRYSIRSNVNSQVKSFLKYGMSIGGTRNEEDRGLSDNNGIIYTALLSAPDIAVRNPDGSFAGAISTGPNANGYGGTPNAVAQASLLTNNLIRSNVNGSIYADLRITRDITFRSEINGGFDWSKALQFNPTFKYGDYENKTANLTEYWSNSHYWTWKEVATFNRTIARKHVINATLGYELNYAMWNGITDYVQNFYSNDLKTLNLGDAKSARVDEYLGSQALQSFISRVNYTYNNRYSLTATFRSDQSSKFVTGKQTGYFPSAAVSWRLSEEPFMAGIKSVADNIKIRIGYGQVGNQGIPNYLYGSALKPSVTGFGTGFLVDKIANPNLTWETAIQSNAGIDFSLFNNRIDATFDYFDKKSEKFLFQAALPAFLVGEGAAGSYLGGVNPPYINGGKLSNKGFEFTINSHNINTANFRWNTTLIFSHYKNKVLSLANGTPFISGNITNGFLTRGITRTEVGHSVGEFYGYVTDGLFTTEAELRNSKPQFGNAVAKSGTWYGDIRYKDLNNDGVIDQKDQTYLGNPNPKFTYGINNTFSYKSVDLNIFLNGSYGAKIMNALNYTISGLSGLYTNQLASAANYWTPANPTSKTPAPRGGLDNPNLFTSDRFLESGSYLRIQNVSLGWNLPPSWLHKIKLTRLKVYASGQNLYTFTKYKGLDPEIGSMNQNVFLTNIDFGRYPSARTITFGLNAEF